jgi:7-carboxy-7-deazaguanine synthase
MNGYLSEIHASFEGEGMRVGMPAVFVRLAGCNLKCSFCDTVYARERTGFFTLYAGSRESAMANPVSPGKVAEVVRTNFPAYPDVRFTGGEPLLQPAFLKECAVLLKRTGFGVHLETNGTLFDEMGEVADFFDTVAMDFKLPSSQDGRSLETSHVRFMESLAGRPFCVKIVVTPECGEEEVEDAFAAVARVRPYVPVFIQPEFDREVPLIKGDKVLRLLLAGRDMLGDVRLSLQIHKILGMR